VWQREVGQLAGSGRGSSGPGCTGAAGAAVGGTSEAPGQCRLLCLHDLGPR